MIEFRNISKTYETKTGTVEALRNINLTIEKGDIFGVIGLSGAGKSTLIRTVNLLETPTAGEVIVNGMNLATLPVKKLRQEQKKIGMIFQHFHLLESKTVFQNVAMPLVLSKVSKKEIEKRVSETLAFVGLSDKMQQYPDQLSGGQKQRVGIARALVTNPAILLCDEATSALDPQTTLSILKLLKKVNQAYNITILMITHQMEVVKEVCNRVAVIEDGEVIETGKMIDLVTNPQKQTTKTFIQSIVRDDIPPAIKQIAERLQTNGKVFSFQYVGTDSDEPIINELIRNYHVRVNILHGNITEIQGIPFGNLLLVLEGTDAEIEAAIAYAKGEHVKVKEVFVHGD